MAKIKKRFCWETNPDGTKKKVYYYPVTHAQAVHIDDSGNTLDAKLGAVENSILEIDEVAAHAIIDLAKRLQIIEQQLNISSVTE